jgi:hypothetical protein
LVNVVDKNLHVRRSFARIGRKLSAKCVKKKRDLRVRGGRFAALQIIHLDSWTSDCQLTARPGKAELLNVPKIFLSRFKSNPGKIANKIIRSWDKTVGFCGRGGGNRPKQRRSRGGVIDLIARRIKRLRYQRWKNTGSKRWFFKASDQTSGAVDWTTRMPKAHLSGYGVYVDRSSRLQQFNCLLLLLPLLRREHSINKTLIRICFGVFRPNVNNGEGRTTSPHRVPGRRRLTAPRGHTVGPQYLRITI